MYSLYDLPKATDLNAIIAERVSAYRARHRHAPTVALVHPSRLAQVQTVLPFARTRQAHEPIPQPGDLLLGAP
jgi:hypothetical protein